MWKEGSKERRQEETGEEGRENYRRINYREGEHDAALFVICASEENSRMSDSSVTSENLAGSSSLSPRSLCPRFGAAAQSSCTAPSLCVCLRLRARTNRHKAVLIHWL